MVSKGESCILGKKITKQWKDVLERIEGPQITQIDADLWLI